MELRGEPYYKGRPAFHPRTGDQVKVCHYGGFVCSRECDWRACVQQHASMPGCAGAARPDTFAMARIRANWGDA